MPAVQGAVPMSNQVASKIYSACLAVLVLIACFTAMSQATSDGLAGAEFPVIMRQNVLAGKTAVGTKVQAKLAVATLVKGTVIPEDAILSGEVTESVAKSASDASRLGIRIDSAQWKNGSTPLKIYLTVWYYPLATESIADPSDNPMSTAHGSVQVSAGGGRPDPRTSAASQPFPDPDTDKNNTTLPPRPHSSISKHRVLMKDVESSRNEDGTVTLISKRFNIKLDKSTTYVLAAGDLGAGSRQQ